MIHAEAYAPPPPALAVANAALDEITRVELPITRAELSPRSRSTIVRTVIGAGVLAGAVMVTFAGEIAVDAIAGIASIFDSGPKRPRRSTRGGR